MNKILCLICALLITQMAYAFDVVYPKNKSVTINSPTTFFVGSSSAPLTINGKEVLLHPTGGFAHFVDLKEGENVFELKSENEVQKFVITKPKKLTGSYKTPQLIEYKEQKNLEVIADNSPLRSTPVDGGINRMSHLQTGVLLVSDGEKAGFYRVKLGEGNYGWISKSNVKIIPEEVKNGEISAFRFVENKQYDAYVFNLSKRVPFTINEEENLTLKLFNVDGYDKNIYVQKPYTNTSEKVQPAGYIGYYDGNDFIFKIRKTKKLNIIRPLHGVTITIDPGHGGTENGAIGCLGDKEKDITLSISKFLEKELKRQGAKVFMTRTKDSYVGLRERVDYANQNDSNFLISIHANSLPDTKNPLEHRGTSIYYYYNQAKPLAESIMNEMTNQAGTKNDKVRQESFALVRNTYALSVLVEIAYLINPEDNAMLVDPVFQEKCAKAIADGIINYLK